MKLFEVFPLWLLVSTLNIQGSLGQGLNFFLPPIAPYTLSRLGLLGTPQLNPLQPLTNPLRPRLGSPLTNPFLLSLANNRLQPSTGINPLQPLTGINPLQPLTRINPLQPSTQINTLQSSRGTNQPQSGDNSDQSDFPYTPITFPFHTPVATPFYARNVMRPVITRMDNPAITPFIGQANGNSLLQRLSNDIKGVQNQETTEQQRCVNWWD